MIRLANSLSILILLIGILNVASASNIARQWPVSKVLEPKGFGAYPLIAGDASACDVEILFQRDFNDQKYDYHIFGNYETADEPQYLPITQYSNSSDKLAFVNATPEGQRGAYFLPNWYTLTPLVVRVCDPYYISLRIPLNPQSYFIKVVLAGQGPESEAVWVSPQFDIDPSATIVPPPGVTQIVAKREDSPDPNSNLIHVQWHLDTLFPDQVQAYFVLIGPGKGAKHIYSSYINNSNATEATVEIGYFFEGYVASVVIWTKDGVLTSPELAPQVDIQ